MPPSPERDGDDDRPTRSSAVRSIVPAIDFRADELESLLLRRLRGASVIFLAGALLGGILGTLHPADIQGSARRFLIVFGLTCALAAWLFTRRQASLRCRRAELLLLALEAAAMSMITFLRLTPPTSADLAAVADSPRFLLWTLESIALYWCFLIVLYGSWIPNTARRCAVVVACLAALPLGLVTVFGIIHPEVRQTLFSEIFLVLVFWVVAASALAVYGSYRINLMRQDLVAGACWGRTTSSARSAGAGWAKFTSPSTSSSVGPAPSR